MRSVLHSILKAVASLPVLQTGDRLPESGGGGNSCLGASHSGGTRWNGGTGGGNAVCEGS